MFDFTASFGFSPLQWALVLLSAALIGMNKTGIVGISLVAIPILASVFGGRAATGVILPVLIAADVIAVISYRRAIRWRDLLVLLPWALLGVGIALVVGMRISDRLFKICVAAIIFIVLIFMAFREFRGGFGAVKKRWYLTAAIGVLGGFATMIGNAAGPIIVVYFLSLQMTKDEFIATRAWFFWIINILKVPLHLFVWKTITPETLGFDLLMVPGVLVGGVLGYFLVKRIPERPYRIFLIMVTAVSALFLIV